MYVSVYLSIYLSEQVYCYGIPWRIISRQGFWTAAGTAQRPERVAPGLHLLGQQMPLMGSRILHSAGARRSPTVIALCRDTT